ncbi:hypothetical protein SRHO_G00018520 [Serrasalmus rhombeus]
MQLLVILLLAVQWTATTLAGIGPPANCCTKLSDKNFNVMNIEKFVVQDPALCPVKAVRFTTIHGKNVCADPEKDWTTFAMCVVDQSKSTSKTKAVAICKGLPVKSMTTPMPVTSKSTTPTVESEAITSSMTTSHTVISKKTAEPTQQFPSTMIPPAQKSTPTVTVPSTHSPSLTSTKTQNSSETSTITTATSKEMPKLTRLPWTLRRLKKKSKSGLRKAQRRRG